ncbi:SirB2 family protein [Phytohalomonas tamaricis]|uniref:SirB2 family protein n=1 Tax=Phytohalomonas tamaricis TaxID=2081032 RepID=UPI000D0B29F3|nr:SirB2 family protein [Phytohalomonas tamaricis]
MSYVLLKYLHISTVILSFALFALRAWWSTVAGDAGVVRLQQQWVRILPHIIDTVLLASGITLMIMLRLLPTENPWLMAKLIGLVIYIAVGTIAIKRGRTQGMRSLAAIIAVLIFIYIVGTALNHDPASWLVDL